jgi:hypothetical protein
MAAVVQDKIYKGVYKYSGETDASSQPHGHGERSFHKAGHAMDGCSYSGQFAGGEKDGAGLFRHALGAVLISEYVRDQIHGVSQTTQLNGDVFRGRYASNKKQGCGLNTLASGMVRMAMYNDDKKTGEALLVRADGTKVVEDWAADVILKSTKGLKILSSLL